MLSSVLLSKITFFVPFGWQLAEFCQDATPQIVTDGKVAATPGLDFCIFSGWVMQPEPLP